MNKQNTPMPYSQAGLGVYMGYLLRYATYPVTVTELIKMASTRHFNRVARFLEQLPLDAVYQSPRDALEHFKQLG